MKIAPSKMDTTTLLNTNHRQLRKIFAEYNHLAKHTIQQAIKRSVHGQFAKALLASDKYYFKLSTLHSEYSICLTINYQCQLSNGLHRIAYRIFRKVFIGLYRAMQGLVTDERTLIRVIVTRSEIDLGAIKDEYKRMFKGELLDDVKVKGFASVSI